jgi:uncharacterized protein with FMN-binding domain
MIPPPPPWLPSAAQPVDPIVAARLARLAERHEQVATEPLSPRSASTITGPRKHPADKSRIAALTMSVATTVGLSVYFARGATPSISTAAAPAKATPTAATAAPNTTVAATASTVAAQAATTTTRASASTVPATAAPSLAPTTAGQTAAQSFTGQMASMKYGPIQVAIGVANGQITSVTTLQQPSDRKSIRINDQALPELENEVVTVQSARVQSVSGATYTSTAYKQSLQSAIDTARSAGVLA